MSRNRRVWRWSGRVECLERRELLTLALAAQNLLATTQAPFNGRVATLVDTDLTQGPLDFNSPPGSVMIDWGDGTASPGVVLGPLVPGLFEVDGSHVFTDAGNFATTINATDRAGQSATAHGLAIVSGSSVSPSLTVEPNPLSGTAGQPTSPATVAIIHDPDPTDTPADLQAMISWGDGHVSAGSVQGGGGVFIVNATNTYAAPGTYTFVVTVLGPDQGSTGAGAGQATIAPVPVYPINGTQVVTPAGQPLMNVPVATFQDANPNDAATNFNASIDWGNGQTGAGIVTGGNSSFTIAGSNTYPLPGTYTIKVALSDPIGRMATATSTAVVVNTSPAGTIFNFSGALSVTPANGPAAASGIATTDRPIFTGTAPPFAVVQLFGRRTDVDATLPLGQAIASGSGQWDLPTGPLSDGLYSITAIVTSPGGYPDPMVPLTSNNGQIAIDTTPPKRATVAHLGGKGGGFVPSFAVTRARHLTREAAPNSRRNGRYHR